MEHGLAIVLGKGSPRLVQLHLAVTKCSMEAEQAVSRHGPAAVEVRRILAGRRRQRVEAQEGVEFPAPARGG